MFRWGIISTGAIANRFVKGAQSLPDTTVLAVGSRTQESADAFGERHGIERRYAFLRGVGRRPRPRRDLHRHATPLPCG